MKAIALVLALACASCATWSKAIWPSVVQCGGPVAGDLVEQIGGILAKGGSATVIGEGASDAIEKLAAENGAQLVTCIIDQLIARWTAPPGAAVDPVVAAKRARAQSFLRARGVRVEQVQP